MAVAEGVDVSLSVGIGVSDGRSDAVGVDTTISVESWGDIGVLVALNVAVTTRISGAGQSQ